jgi:hypothetical protein
MGKMSGCKDCFYALKDSSEFPCNICKGYDYYLHKDVYKEQDDNKAWAKVVEGLNGTTKEDMWPDLDDFSKEAYEKEVKELESRYYDSVSKPKHYMLFDQGDVTGYAYVGKGIEVRDVIAELVRKVATQMGAGKINYSPLFESDYVQMMQYLMRFMDKNGVEDLKKARWYLDKLIEAY